MQKYLRTSLPFPSLLNVLVLAAVWLVLSEGIDGSWVIGLPVIILVAMLIAWMEEDADHFPLSFSGLAVFVPFFLRQSVLSGFDVALRALRPDMGLRPALLNYRISLPDGPPRRLFVNSITLMPGTLSVLVQGEKVVVHVLDENQPFNAALHHLENRVAAVFLTPKKGRGSL